MIVALWTLCAAVGADLFVDGTVVTLDGTHTYGVVEVVNGGTLAVTPWDGTGTTGTLHIVASRMFVDATSAVDASGAGYRGVLAAPGEGPGGGGEGLVVGGGGGRGGAGGAGTAPGCIADGLGGPAAGGVGAAEPGSGGGGAPGVAGGSGGGAVILEVDDLTLLGSVAADGLGGGAAGGGAGGGISLRANALTCLGVLSARGGGGGSGGSGGGGTVLQAFDEVGVPCVAQVGVVAGACPGMLEAGAGVEVATGADYDGDGQRAWEGDCLAVDPAIWSGGTEVCNGLDDDCSGLADDTLTCGCNRRIYGTTTYQFCNAARTWTTARNACTSLGRYHLVSLEDSGENSWVSGRAQSLNSGTWWIGYNDGAVEGTFVWQGGSLSTFENWEPGQPNNTGDCTTIGQFSNARRWNDDNCSDTRPYVCEACTPRAWHPDADGDGWGDIATRSVGCYPPAVGHVSRGGDCDDGDPARHPGQPDVCNGVDDDCDGLVDDATGVAAWFVDVDGDGYGADAELAFSAGCGTTPAGATATGGDCDDSTGAIGPGALEVCNGVDDDCDGVVDNNGVCGCATAQEAGSVYQICAAPLAWNNAAAWCAADGYHLVTIDDAEEDAWVRAAADLFDSGDWWLGNNDRVTEGTWVWDGGGGSGYDNWASGEPNNAGNEDCGSVRGDGEWNDLPCGDPHPYVCERTCSGVGYVDADRDGYGDPGRPVQQCGPSAGTAANGLDCDDTDPLVHPAAFEIAGDGLDSDCDGVDTCWRDADGDGIGGSVRVTGADLDCSDEPTASDRTGDCDDAASWRAPGVAEVAGDGLDQDCDGVDHCFVDVDGDGHGAGAAVRGRSAACTAPGESASGADCDDGDPLVSPSAVELPADGVDSDCDGGELCPIDLDGDGFGRASLTNSVDLDCLDPGEATNAADCDDDESEVFPGNPEQCDGLDNDCAGGVDDGLPTETFFGDGDGDGFGDPALSTDACGGPPPGFVRNPLDCDDGDPGIPAASETLCDGVDNDCRPGTDDDADADGDGATLCLGDCDDTDPANTPGAPELCDGADNDCDGLPDDGLTFEDWWPDADGDGFGDATAAPVSLCDTPPSGLVRDGTDCDDAQPAVHPGATEVPDNGIDEDCDGADVLVPHTADTAPVPPGDTAGGDTDADTAAERAPRPPERPEAPPDPDGCGCRAAGPGAWMSLASTLLYRRR